ncbi:TylF/MycF/NovP-related O-methyltransferase [Brevibacillus nitrificans]|uniref:TylF/MycF/NovP-related O-methyltransferase n=1 Tax=Brevibacillus nitrificans TaxID=651560 RepID=UPI0026033E6E|nr:TylF/MycF/NovP-related O-methyltransferase [Brevibacillus nitrificans]MED1794892.1 TylF/MycF/NovP-related O-methyltransferase [Brevibacillus nitrificans]
MFKILLFGAGSVSKDLVSILDFDKVQILAYVDNNKTIQNTLIDNINVISPNKITLFEFDYIIVTSTYYDEIYKQLIHLGIHKNKIVGYLDHYSQKFTELVDQLNSHTAILNQLCLSPIEPYAACNVRNLGRNRLLDVYQTKDYVRLSSIELVAQEIYDLNIIGSIAELGVFRGDFAKILNEVFYDRKLFLFDTFEGFNEQDVAIESKENYSASSISDFSNTNVDLVLSKMKYPQNCIVKKGYFPNTAEDLYDEQFAFVSIDTDLFNPIYSGLNFFYPRMVKGGYIFIHDYNNSRFKGAKEAVRKFCDENSVSYFPLSDFSGTAVIIK